jgi:hypothetical protein
MKIVERWWVVGKGQKKEGIRVLARVWVVGVVGPSDQMGLII